MAIGSALSVGLIGLKAFIIQIQAFISPGLPYFSIIGLPDTSLSEARERVKSACQASGFKWPETRVTVNLSPASMPKKGSSHDLAIAASVLSASGTIGHDCLADTIVLGEVNLDGTVLPVNGLLPIMLHAREQGIRQVIVPHANIDEARLIDDIDVIGVRHVGELIELMGGHATYHIPDTQRDIGTGMDVTQCSAPGDMCEVVGQESTKWALEVAAAGGHHLLMTGPPGTGKTMLASRMPGIMSPLNETEQLEIASIRSLCGTLPSYGITDVPPFEAPHHTASMASLVGGRTGLAQPGAITRAHRGILFMDEAPEFSARALQTLREPLESGYVAISRSKGTTYYPARFQLIMAANPCPLRFFLWQWRTLRLQREGPHQILQPSFRSDSRPYRHSSRSAAGRPHRFGKPTDRRIQPHNPTAGHGGPADGPGTLPRIRMVLQRASHRHVVARQYLT